MKLMFLGDIHGDFNILTKYVIQYDIRDANIIQVGDFGIGFRKFYKDKKLLTYRNDLLKKYNVFIYSIRGNHDYKLYFDNDPFNLSNIKFIKDYTVLNLSKKNILCIGGAISIDRKERTKNTWFKDEVLDVNIDKIKKIESIDVVVTHTAPNYCIPNGFYPYLLKDMFKNDFTLKYDLEKERFDLACMFNILTKNNNITNHYYGHFHQANSMNYNGTRHRVLGINELVEF